MAEAVHDRELYRDKASKMENANKIMIDKFKYSDGHDEVKNLLNQIQIKLSMNKNVDSFDLGDEEKQFLVYLLGQPGSTAQPLNQRKSIISDFSDPKKDKKQKSKKAKVSQDEIK